MKLSTVCLLGLCHIGSAAALGLGDASVRSYLGQPLDASIAVLGATPEVAADCFHIVSADGGIATIPRARLSLDRIGGQVFLRIRTPQAIHDPVAQFVVIADCTARLQRDYVVLLDPPPVIDTPVVAESSPAVPQAARRTGTRRTPAPAASSPRAGTGASAPHRKPAAHSGVAEQPRLILSGRHRAAGTEGVFALRLDTNLPDPARIGAERLTATELSDENTALARKLAHLESQLAALQLRNAQLEARPAHAPATQAAPVAKPSVPNSPQWPLVLLALGLLGSAAVLVAWMRRRARTAPETVLPDVLAWTPTAAGTPAGPLDAMPATDTLQAAPRIAEIPRPAAEDKGTEVKEDILDQAEVFMAHGHGDLAMHLLQEHLREAPTESPVPWLLLLDLLHRAGDTAGYAAASTECRRYFNVNLTGHPISQDGNEPGPGLEAYPHLLEKLVHVWNTPDVGAFFEDLIYDKRGGTRVGFEPGAYRDILLLRDIAQQDLPLAA